MGSKRDACLATVASFTMAVMTILGSIPVQRTFRVLRKLGNGQFGSVFELQDKAAVSKTIACKQIERTQQGDEDFQQELLMLKLLGYHPNLNSLTGWCQTKSFSYIMLDMCHGGTLEDVVNSTTSGFAENRAAGVLHNDLKPENIFLARKDDMTANNLVIGDFGLANTLEHYTENWDEAGTPGWMAPEAKDGVHSHKTDVFSLGAILFFMVTGTRPFKTSPVGRNTYYTYGHINLMLKLRGVSDGLKACILSMLAKDPDSRYSLTEALHDPWLLEATKLNQVATCSHPHPPHSSPHPAPPHIPLPTAPAASNTSRHVVTKPALKAVGSPHKTRAQTRFDTHACITEAAKTNPVPLVQPATRSEKRKAQLPGHANCLSACLGKGGLENVNPNPQRSMHRSMIPGPLKQTTVHASLPMSSSYQAANQPDSTSPHPRVSAANIARPTRLPSPPFRASPAAADAKQYNAAAASSPLAPSDASAPVNHDAMPAHENIVAAAQPTAVAKPRRHLPLPSRSASFLAPAAGATASHEGSSSTALAPAHSAPSQAHTSAQTTMLTAGNPTISQTVSEAQCGAPSAAAAAAAAAYGAPAACIGKVVPVQRTTAIARDAVKKVPAASGQPATIPVARCTRAATKQRAMTSKSKPHTSSTKPMSPALDDSSPCDSDSIPNDDNVTANNGRQGNMAAAAQPTAAAAAALNRAGACSTAQAPAHSAPFQAVVRTAAATACGAPAACHSKAAPVPRTIAAAHHAVEKVPATSGQPVAKCTRAATRQRALTSQPKPHTSSTQPISPAPEGPSSYDSDSSSDDETAQTSNGAAAVTQRHGGLHGGSPEAIPMMMANPLYTGNRTSSQINTGLPIKAVNAQAYVPPGSHAHSTVQGEQAGARPKRGRSDQGHCEGTIPADESKSKKVRFTEPLKDIGHAHCTLSSTQEQRSRTAAPHRQAADDSNAARRSKTAAQAATKRRSRRNTRKQLTASAARQAGASGEAPAPQPSKHTSRLEPVRTRAATRAAAANRPKKAKSAAAATRPKKPESAAAATRPKRKQFATAASTEEEQFPIAKRARADGAGSSLIGRTVPRPLA